MRKVLVTHDTSWDLNSEIITDAISQNGLNKKGPSNTTSPEGGCIIHNLLP